MPNPSLEPIMEMVSHATSVTMAQRHNVRHEAHQAMKWTRIFVLVSCGALAGMVMGGLFGFGAGSIAPTFFAHLIPWSDVEPRGVATVFGGIAGVLLGGSLATFGIIVQILMQRRTNKA